MEIVKPVSLNYTSTPSSISSPYAAWVPYIFNVQGTYYRGDRVFSDPDDGGNGREYECDWWYLKSTTRPENSSAWIDLGAASGQTASYHTDADLTKYSDWTSGASVNSGARVYDPQSLRDYEALVDISGADNKTRPSTAVISSDETLASRWFDLGPSNGFALLDGKASTRTTAETSLTFTVLAEGQCDRLVFAGVNNAASISATAVAGQKIANASFISSPTPFWSRVQVAVTITHNNPGMRITNSNGAAEGGANTYIDSFVPGVPYVMTATATSGALKVQIKNSSASIIAESNSVSGAGTCTVTWTPTETRQEIYLRCPPGTSQTNISAVSLKHSGVTTQNLSTNLEIETSGRYRRIVSVPHTSIDWPQYQITVTAPFAKQELGVGIVMAGLATNCGCTRANVESGGSDYSRRDRDQYGTVSYRRRGSSKKFRAIVELEGTTGDYVAEVVEDVRGNPAFFDFNNTGTNYTRLQVHGWATEAYTVVTGLPNTDTLVLEMEGMVE